MRRIGASATTCALAVAVYAATAFGRLFLPPQLDFVVMLLCSAIALACLVWMLVRCVVSKFRSRRDVMVSIASAALVVAVVMSTFVLRSLGARVFLAMHRDQLAVLVDQLTAERAIRSQREPWILEAFRAPASPQSIERAVRAAGFIMAEVTTRHVALSHDAFQGTHVGLLYDRPGPRSIEEGDRLFAREVVLLQALEPSWYLFATR